MLIVGDGIVTLTSVEPPDATCGYVVAITQPVELHVSCCQIFESFGSDCAIRISGQQMAARMELAVDECVSGKEVLSLLWRFESLHLAFSTSSWSM